MKHPLYACPQFRLLTHDKMLSTVRSNNVCLNCLKPGHFSKNCGSSRKCQRPHHSLLHIEVKPTMEQDSPPRENVRNSALAIAPMVSSHTESGYGSTLLMTCQMFVNAPDGTRIMACGLLDSEPLAQFLRLPLSTQHIRISGTTDMSCRSSLQSVAQSHLCFHLLRGC